MCFVVVDVACLLYYSCLVRVLFVLCMLGCVCCYALCVLLFGFGVVVMLLCVYDVATLVVVMRCNVCLYVVCAFVVCCCCVCWCWFCFIVYGVCFVIYVMVCVVCSALRVYVVVVCSLLLVLLLRAAL